MIFDKYPEAKEFLRYFYELWTSRAPATGFNRDGAWQNGANYFSANAVSLMYLPKLFGYATGTDFLRHPWYQNAGKGVACTWIPGSLSSGFGDGHEKMNEKPLRIRSAFADFLARELGDSYAAWYSERIRSTRASLRPVFTVWLAERNVRHRVRFLKARRKRCGLRIAAR